MPGYSWLSLKHYHISFSTSSSSSSFQTALCNFQAMAVEEDNCKIALVVEPKISKPDW